MTHGILRGIGSTFTAVLAALTIACGGGGESVGSQSAALGSGAPAYLALGDSVAYGLNPLLVPPPNENAFVGYPQILQALVDWPLENAACPGETTESFLSLDAAGVGVAGNCAAFKASGWLHADYTSSQLDYALEFLRTHPRVELVTIALGANDLFDVQEKCGFDPSCVIPSLPDALQKIGTNVGRILGAIEFEAGYDGRVLIPLYYAPSPGMFETQAATFLNQTLRTVGEAFGAEIVDVQTAFREASEDFGEDPCAAGLLIPLPGGGCDHHPTPAGAQIIAAEIAAVVASQPF